MNFKKRVNGSWVDTPNYIHNTSTDTITTLPAVLYPNGTTATVGLKGNMYQASGVSPTNPIQPQECGDLETTGTHAGQYKIPISSAGQTTNIYLGEVETTRKIKKLVLDGTENWNYSATSQAYWVANVPNDYDNTLASQITTVCTHYRCIRNDTGLVGMINGDLRLYAKITSPIAHELYIKDETYTSAANFKAYLQQQYAAGTPVTVWYVLATPENAVVNEPLRKIGDYADEVSGITIPTIAGANTLSVDTTLQPSEVTVNYKGWHPVADVHEKSENLFDMTATDTNNGYIPDGYLNSDGSKIDTSEYRVSEYIAVSPSQSYTLVYGSTLNAPSVCFYDGSKNFINGVAYSGRESVSFTTRQNTAFLRLSFRAIDYNKVMLNTGSTALPYEPYWK